MNGSVPIFHKMTALDTFSWYDVLTWNCANSCPNAQSEFAIPQDNIDLHKQINKAHNNSWTVLQFYWSWLETVRWRCCSVTRGVSAGAIPKAPVESPQYPSTSTTDLLVTAARLYHWPCKTNLWQRQRSIYCQARVCSRIMYKYIYILYNILVVTVSCPKRTKRCTARGVFYLHVFSWFFDLQATSEARQRLTGKIFAWGANWVLPVARGR